MKFKDVCTPNVILKTPVKMIGAYRIREVRRLEERISVGFHMTAATV